MVRTKLYVEGGGSKALNRECRRGFGAFLTKAGVAPGTVAVEACGPRGDAYRTFSADSHKGLSAILLVDAEAPVTTQCPWQHLRANDGWDRPRGATDDQCHLMVQVMESWFLADGATLESFYGRDFRPQDLPQNPNIEEVLKESVHNSLDQATKNTGKGRYSKSKHSFAILQRLDPVRVRSASGYADRFIRALSE